MNLHEQVPDENRASAAFSKQSAIFDELERENPIVLELRRRIRRHVLSLVRPEETLLELNAGTGLDAVEFARRGIRVTATDIADGMIEQMRRKADHYSLGEYLQVRQCSFTSLEELPDKELDSELTFDHIFSNFGGLNCAEDLAAVIQSLKPLLKPQGTVTLVIMPPVCPWEIFSVLRGNRRAFRRLKRGGTMAHVEGEYFRVWYYSPRYVEQAFGAGFERILLEGLASIAPPPHAAEHFAKRFPRAYAVLARIDEGLSRLPVFRSCADHFLISFRKK
jgi:ubiquinone/menaquinone biosynthesis C-methylase UbiE